MKGDVVEVDAISALVKGIADRLDPAVLTAGSVDENVLDSGGEKT